MKNYVFIHQIGFIPEHNIFARFGDDIFVILHHFMTHANSIWSVIRVDTFISSTTVVWGKYLGSNAIIQL